MRRRTVLLLVLLIVVVVGAVAVLVVSRTSDSSDPVAVTEAVERYRDSRGRGAGTGVYVYDTTGYERLSALGGRRHDYPRVTTITVTSPSSPCQLARWDALSIRWTEVETCPSEGGDGLRSFTESRQFFGQTREKTLTCDPGALARGAGEPAMTWHNRCGAEDETLEATGTVVEPGHFRLEQRHTGARVGTSTVEEWVRVSDGLLLRRKVTVDVTIGTRIGRADYHEEYELRLRSDEPRR